MEVLNKEHITRGEAVVMNRAVYVDGLCVSETDDYNVSFAVSEANAEFIKDCFNVLNESGKTARELLAENDQLENDCKTTEDALLAVFDCMLQYMPKSDVEKMRKQLLNK